MNHGFFKLQEIEFQETFPRQSMKKINGLLIGSVGLLLSTAWVSSPAAAMVPVSPIGTDLATHHLATHLTTQFQKPIAQKSAKLTAAWEQPLLAEATPVFPADGVYVFGQSPVPNQLATTYLVLEAHAGNVVGGFYMPSSSFDCVQGEIQDNQLALRITESYSQDTYDYALGLSRQGTVAGRPSTQISLEGFYALDTMSDVDQHVLETCQAFYGGSI